MFIVVTSDKGLEIGFVFVCFPPFCIVFVLCVVCLLLLCCLQFVSVL